MHFEIIVVALVVAITPNFTYGQSGLTCHIKGECQGAFLGLGESGEYNSCLGECQGSTNCNYFTSDAALKRCFLYATCDSIISACNECYSGEKGTFSYPGT